MDIQRIWASVISFDSHPAQNPRQLQFNPLKVIPQGLCGATLRELEEDPQQK